jgi:hypothetical protein
MNKKILLFFILLFCVHTCFATDYYISPSGKDANSGTSISNAWKTMDKVGSFAWSPGFVAGDNILFEGGQTFMSSSGIYVQLDKTKGTALNPITFSSYGTGKALLKSNASNLFGLWAPSTGTVSLGFKFTNLILEGDGITKAGPTGVVGISVWNSSSTALNYLLVEDVEIRNFAGNGFAMGRDNFKGRLTNVVLRRVVSHNNPGAVGLSANTGSGIIIGGADGALVEECVAYSNGTNNNNPAGPVGIWMWDSINSIIQKCESHHNETTYGDGGGFDIDGACQNCIIQYCYSHDNAGAGYLLAQYSGASSVNQLKNNIIRYNISENDARKGNFGAIHFWGNGGSDFVGATDIYNNTIFLGGSAANGTPAAVSFQGTNCSGIKIRNNIFVASSNYDLIASTSGAMDISKAQFQNNDYWTMPGTTFKIKWGSTTYNSVSNWQSATGQEKSNTTNLGYSIDPQLTDPGNGGTLNNPSLLNSLTAYKLNSASGLIDKGLDLTQSPYNMSIGIKDFYGTNIPNNEFYEIGSYEYVNSLPVNMTNYSGKATLTSNVLTWKTLSEQNNSGFEILRSKDGVEFEKIGFKKSFAINGNSNAPLDYSFNDATSSDDEYYQLNQIDLNGKSSLSNTIMIKAGLESENRVYPNPVTDKLNIEISSVNSDKATISIIDQSGKTVVSVQEVFSKDKKTIKLNTTNLSAGWYLLNIKNAAGDQILSRKIIKI